ncbi:MAG: PqqD family protein [Verrucomicrobiae bacterium]|nr:PqqD family protein [Verrucomicrobiae bacterium]
MKSSPLKTLLLNEGGVAFDPARGETYQLSASGLTLVRMLIGGADQKSLLEFLLREYEVSESTARRDLQTFLGELEKRGWL